jgi:hypothetical protein
MMGKARFGLEPGPVAKRLGLKPTRGHPWPVGGAGESAEAVFETPRGLTIIHSQVGTVGLALAGRALFSRLLLAREHPGVEVLSYATATSPDDVVARMIRSYDGCDVV